MSGNVNDKGQSIKAAERRVKVLELKKGGASVRAIASHLNSQGIKCSKSTVANDINDSMKRLSEEEMRLAEELRVLELQRIDSLWLAHWEKGLKGDIASGWMLLGLSKRRSDLIPGMMPSKRAVNLNFKKGELEKMTDDELDELISQLG